MNRKERLVVIGNGMAGARLLEELVARGGNDLFDMTVFGEEPYGNYNRILLSSVLAGDHRPEDIFLNPLDWYRSNGIALHAGVRVQHIDRQTKTVHADGIAVAYDRLVFATGAKPFIPPIENLHSGDRFKSGVFVFRTLDDSLEMTKHAATSKKAIVIGGGLLGLEAARGLAGRGLQVHVVERMSHIMEVQLDAAAAAVLRSTLEKLGLQFHLAASVTKVLGEDRVEGIMFGDGSVESCDMLVLSAGIRPNTELARDAGLQVERGIMVGDDLACANDVSVHAIGECAQHRGRTYGLVAPAWEQARVLADRLTQSALNAVYEGSSTSTKLKVMGVELLVLGAKEACAETDEVVTYAEPNRGVYKKLVVRDGRLAGAIMLGDGLTGPRVLQAFHRGETLPEARADLLFPPAAGSSQPNVADQPDSLQVCNCNGVSKGTILQAVQSGCRTLKSVCETTRAATGCGSCKAHVQALLESAGDGLAADDPSIHYYVPAVPLAKPELIQQIRAQGLKSVSSVFAALAGGKEDPKSKAGLASLLRTVWGADYEDERDARYINDRVHANIQKDGTFSVVPRILGGVVTAQQLRSIADVAEKYDVPMVKITGGQRIDLLGIPKEQLPGVWKDLGMPSGHAYTKAVRTVKTCVGEEFCRFGLGDSTTLGIDIERKFQGLESPHKIKMAVSGCPRNCAESTTKDIGIVAIEGGLWEIYVGGAAGSRVRKGDVLCVVDSEEDAIRFTGRFIQYYREHARYMERTYDFVERIGIDKIRAVLIDDAEEMVQRLDDSLEEAVRAFKDPWTEGDAPVHPLQFADSIEPVAVLELKGAAQ